MLKSQGANSKCIYGVTLPGEYLQVARRWQRRCLCIWCYTWSSLGTSSPQPLMSPADFASPTDFASFADFATVTSVSLQRKPYQCMHTWVHIAMSAEDSPNLKIVTVTYECTEPSSVVLPRMALYVTCSSGAPSATIASSREPLKSNTRK